MNINLCTSLDLFASVCNLTSDQSGPILSTVISLLFVFAVIIAVLYLIYGGIKWIMSRGDKEKVEDARNHIVAAAVGLIIVFLAFFIINIVLGVFFPGKSIKDLTLPSLGPDTILPTTSIVSPLNNSTILGSATIQATAIDNKQVVKVEFYIDGSLKSTVTKPPYEYKWNTTSYRHNSSHTIVTKAYDPSGNIGISNTTSIVTIDVTKPNAAIINPANGSSVTQNALVTIQAQTSDVSGIADVEFRVNGISKCKIIAAPYNCAWRVPPSAGIVYRLDVVATDIAGNITNASNTATSK